MRQQKEQAVQQLNDMTQQKEQTLQQLYDVRQQKEQELYDMRQQKEQELTDMKEQTLQQLRDMKEQIDAYEKMMQQSTNQITQTANFIDYYLDLSVSSNSIDNVQVPAMNETKIIVYRSDLD